MWGVSAIHDCHVCDSRQTIWAELLQFQCFYILLDNCSNNWVEYNCWTSIFYGNFITFCLRFIPKVCCHDLGTAPKKQTLILPSFALFSINTYSIRNNRVLFCGSEVNNMVWVPTNAKSNGLLCIKLQRRISRRNRKTFTMHFVPRSARCMSR